jgi:thioredoxin
MHSGLMTPGRKGIQITNLQPISRKETLAMYPELTIGTEANFYEEVVDYSNKMPVLVDYWSPSCAPCKMILPMLENLAKVYADQIKIVKVDVSANPDLATAAGIRSVPTLHIMVNMVVVKIQIGAIPNSKLIELIESVL